MRILPPTIEVIRPVLNVDQQVLDTLGSIAVELGMTGVRMKQPRHVNCTILGGGEVRNAADAAGVTLTNKGADVLANYVDEQLPNGDDNDVEEDNLTISALPIFVNKIGNHQRNYVIGLGAFQPKLQAEQQVARNAVSKWLELPADHPVWCEKRREPSVVVAVVGKRATAEELAHAYQASGYVLGLDIQLSHPIITSFEETIKMDS